MRLLACRLLCPSLLFLPLIYAYEASISDLEDARQVCSGMYGGSTPFINISFADNSRGELAAVIYEWTDVAYLGKITSETDETLPQKTYVCTSDAVANGFCESQNLSEFIIDLPPDKKINDTSLWTSRIVFQNGTQANQNSSTQVTRSFQIAPNQVLARASVDYSPFRRSPIALSLARSVKRQTTGNGLYTVPITYPVRRTGYYCVAVVPVTVVLQDSGETLHSTFTGTILFQNTFTGKLPATDYPKVQLYFVLLLIYIALGALWGFMCWRHREDLLPIQYYVSSLVGFLIIEMLASWAYYRYLNSHGSGTVATIFLFVVAILDAGRNSLSLFLLLVVSLGLSVVKETLGPLMTRCWLLGVTHFIFGVLYAVGIVELELESTSALVLLLFIVPLAFTLSGFLSWIMYALNRTISHLQSRKQHYKLQMFQRLYYILMGTVVVIGIFFVVSSMSFSSRLQQNYAAETWATRWWLLDGWLALLYLAVFSSVAFIWRPSENNRRLAMSDELAQDEDEAAEYDLATMGRHERLNDDDEDNDGEPDMDSRRGYGSLGTDDVVFEIGDAEMQDSDDEHHTKTPRK